MIASTLLATVRLDNVRDPAATAPYAVADAPKKSPTNTPAVNFAMNLASLGQVRLYHGVADSVS
jgi:hypothetical protein